ncbi:hypothetical protein [Mycobacterium sp.]|uniref:hypothetical protein n=1 Tax=Mycobacterium sp. TaxID=1785 RepID=UPI0034126157
MTTPTHIVRIRLYKVAANPPAAMACTPMSPMMAKSVAVKATWANWTPAIGAANAVSCRLVRTK